MTPDPRSGLVAPLRGLVEKWDQADPDEFRCFECARDLEDFIKTLIGSLPQQEEKMPFCVVCHQPIYGGQEISVDGNGESHLDCARGVGPQTPEEPQP